MTLVNTETGEVGESVNYDIHPAATLFPLIEGDAFRALVQDIRTRGQEVPVVLDRDGRLLDGRNRARACAALGIDVKETRYSGDDPFGFVISHNMHRRHLTESQRAMVAAKVAVLQRGNPTGANQHVGGIAPIGAIPHLTQADAAKQLNVSRNSVQRATKVRDHGTPEMQAAVEAGKLSVSKAADLIDTALKTREKVALPATQPERVTGRAAKAELLADLATQGYTSEQMRRHLDYSRAEQVRDLAREYDIEIPADTVRGKTRRIDHARVLDNVTEALEVAAMSLRDIDVAQLDREAALERVDSLTTSINALSKAVKKIKESFHG